LSQNLNDGATSTVDSCTIFHLTAAIIIVDDVDYVDLKLSYLFLMIKTNINDGDK